MRRVRYALLVAVIYLLSAQTISFKRSPDFGRFLRDGELILSGQTAVLHENYYSYTNPSAPFPNHHWLAAVIAYVVFKAMGYTGLNLLWISLAACAFLLYARLAESEVDPSLAAAFAAALLPLMASRTGVRPENFSVFLTASFFFVLWRSYKGTLSARWLWILPVFEALWVNLHPGFALGFAVIGTFLVTELIETWRTRQGIYSGRSLQHGAVLALSVIGALANPNGIRGLLFPFTVSSNYAMDVRENLSMLASGDTPVAVLTGAAAAALIASWMLAFRRRVKIELPLLILSTAFTAMSLVFYRIYVFAGGIILVTLCVNISSVLASRRADKQTTSKKHAKTSPDPVNPQKVLVWVACAVSAVACTSFLSSRWSTIGLGSAPGEEALGDFLLANSISGKIFNNYGSGGYLIHFLPGEKIYFDSRPEAYPAQFVLKDYKRALENEDDWRRVVRTYDFDYICFVQFNREEADFLLRRVRDPEWAVVRSGMEMVLVRRKPRFEAVIRQYGQRF